MATQTVLGAEIFTKLNKVNPHFKENDRQDFLPMIKFELSNKNRNFRKFVSTMSSQFPTT